MDLDFPEVIDLIREIKISETGKPLIDSEIAFLQCAWEGISYGKFIRQQDEITRKYAQCYDNRLRSKTEKTLASCGSKFLTFLSEYFSIDIDRVGFRGIIEDLVEKDRIKVPARIEVKSSPDTLNLRFRSTEFININQDIETVIQFIHSKLPVASLYGAPGIGKTTLLNYVREYCGSNTELRAIYIDLRYIESFKQLAFEILTQAKIATDLEEDTLISEIFDYLESNNVLILLDSIVQIPQELAAFIETFALRNSDFSSKIIISGIKKISLSLPVSKIQYYQLTGLKSINDINAYFDYLGLKNEKHWNEMAVFYQGNYREIKYAAEFILTF